MRAMILAAGYGTRLWPLTIDRAKPAIPFMGRPLVGYVAEYLARHGFRDIVVNLHHQSESIRAALGDGSRFGVRFQYVEEPIILGTSGALDNARDLLDGDTFVVINGKLATDIDLGAALETHKRTHALATLVLKANPQRERYSVVHTLEGLVTGFGGFPALESDNVSAGKDKEVEEAGRDASPLMFTGIQVFDPRVFELIPRGVFSHSVTDVFIPAIERGERLAAHISEGNWYELSTVRRYLDTSIALMSLEGRDIELGSGATVDDGADVRESVLWENAHVAAGARVYRAVLGAGVRVESGETLENVAVVRAELIRGVEPPPKGLKGQVLGSNFVAPIPE